MIAWLAGTSAAMERFTFGRPLMGTRFTVVCFSGHRAAAAVATDAAFAIAEALNTTASDYLPASELSQLASKPTGSPIPLSPTLFELLGHSRRLSAVTGGSFDPTLGPLTRLWRETRDHGRLPDPAILQGARAAVGWRHFDLDPANRTLTLHRENMAFDLGGVAKGYAADLMLDSLAAAGIRQAMVAAGGDIRLGDPPPRSDGWRVALQTFNPSQCDEVLILSNAAVSTSGDLHQAVEIEGVRYSHILDPSTGLGLSHRIAASVIADEAKLSDPLATAACVLGPDGCDGLRMLPGIRMVKVSILQDATVPGGK
jgi:FAD:protein FMN transferase